MKAIVVNFCHNCSRFIPCLEKDDNMRRDEELGFCIPGPDCPLPDVPKIPGSMAGSVEWSEYKRKCFAFVEKLRGMK